MGWSEDSQNPGEMDPAVKQNYLETSPIAFVGESQALEFS